MTVRRQSLLRRWVPLLQRRQQCELTSFVRKTRSSPFPALGLNDAAVGESQHDAVTRRHRAQIEGIAFAWYKVPKCASQIRTAFSSMAWNTGSKSPGELVMTFNTSSWQSAACNCQIRALAQFVEQPRVLDGDDGLGGEVLHQRDLLVGERFNLLRDK